MVVLRSVACLSTFQSVCFCRNDVTNACVTIHIPYQRGNIKFEIGKTYMNYFFTHSSRLSGIYTKFDGHSGA